MNTRSGGHLVELEELLLLLQGLSRDRGAVAAKSLLAKTVVAVGVGPLQDPSAVHHLHQNKVCPVQITIREFLQGPAWASLHPFLTQPQMTALPNQKTPTVGCASSQAGEG